MKITLMVRIFKQCTANYSKGFSLVELSVSLVIIGMIASSALSVAIVDDYKAKKRETVLKMAKIQEAITGFVSFNKRLPCPADGELLLTDNNFGIEGNIANHASTPQPCQGANNTSGNVQKGVVPIITLKLPPDFMFDAWGRRISYAVDLFAVHNDISLGNCGSLLGGSTSSDCFVGIEDHPNTINILDNLGNSISRPVYVLVSHGENGHGAYLKTGGNQRVNGFQGSGNPYANATAAADEINNANMNINGSNNYNSEYVSRSFTKVDNQNTAASNRVFFDDIVMFKTKDTIIQDTGHLIYNHACLAASDIVEDSFSNYCTSAVGENECENFALEVYSRCLR